MNPKILKLRAERDKIRTKLAELQERGKEVNKQLRELENTEVIGMFRDRGLSLEQLASLLNGTEGPLAEASPETEDGPVSAAGRRRKRDSESLETGPNETNSEDDDGEI